MLPLKKKKKKQASSLKICTNIFHSFGISRAGNEPNSFLLSPQSYTAERLSGAQIKLFQSEFPSCGPTDHHQFGFSLFFPEWSQYSHLSKKEGSWCSP
jgi:hypothetical protein